LCLGIVIEAIERLFESEPIKDAKLLLIVGFIGLFINLIGLVIFGHAHSHGIPPVLDDEDDDDSDSEDETSKSESEENLVECTDLKDVESNANEIVKNKSDDKKLKDNKTKNEKVNDSDGKNNKSKKSTTKCQIMCKMKFFSTIFNYYIM
jgi:zinc transporter 1